MVTFLGLLVQSCCGEVGNLQTNITGVCGECSQCLSHTGFAPTHGMCASQALCCSVRNCLRWDLGCTHFPGLSCSGSVSRVLYKGADSVWPAFCALPRSEQLRRRGAWQAHSPHVGLCILSPPPLKLLSFLGARTAGAPSRCAVCLLWGADLWLRPSWRTSTVQGPRKEDSASNWEPAAVW